MDGKKDGVWTWYDEAGKVTTQTYSKGELVFSQTLRQADHPEVALVTDGHREAVAALKASPGKDIWLFGGGSLFRSLAEDGLVDTVEVGIMPILLGAGLPLLPSLAKRIKLSLTAHRVSKTGVVSLEYAIT